MRQTRDCYNFNVISIKLRYQYMKEFGVLRTLSVPYQEDFYRHLQEGDQYMPFKSPTYDIYNSFAGFQALFQTDLLFVFLCKFLLVC